MHENLLLLLLYFFKSRSRRTNLCFAQPLLNIRVLSCLHLHPQKKKNTDSALLITELSRLWRPTSLLGCVLLLRQSRRSAAPPTYKYTICNINADVKMCMCVWRSERERESERQSVSLSRNPNDGIEWPRLSLPWWQAPWICVTEGKERAETQRSTQDFDRVKRKANY